MLLENLTGSTGILPVPSALRNGTHVVQKFRSRVLKKRAVPAVLARRSTY